MIHSECSEILAWLNAEQTKAERWGYSRGNTGVFRFGLTGPELMRIRAALGVPKERLYHEIQCPTLTKSGPCNCATQIIVAEPAAPLPASAALQEWEPIETAPTDGTHVVLFGTLWNDPDQRPRACVSWYCRRRADSPAHALGWFFSAPGYSNGFNPTHWAPLPVAAALRGIAAPPPDQEPT